MPLPRKGSRRLRDIVVEVREHKDGTGTFYVYWTTSSAYGLRGYGLTLEAAEDLAERVRRDGPNAGLS